MKPKVLYKYREWKNPFHQKLIRNGELYLANPKSFEDKYDCHIPLDFKSLTDKQIKKRYFKYSLKINQTFTLKEHKEFSNVWLKKGRLRDEKECGKIESIYFDKFDRQAGILSLALNSSNYKMWQKYADEHKGFCVGLDFKRIRKDLNLFDSYGKVRYKKALPSISPLVNDNPNKEKRTWIIQIFTKLIEWKFEKEFRIFKMSFKRELTDFDRKIFVPPIYFKEIILGANIATQSKSQIIDIVNKKYPHISIFQAKVLGEKVIREKI